MRRDIPIITTPHAKKHLTSGDDRFTSVFAIDPFEQIDVDIQGPQGVKKPGLRVTGMPGKHVPPNRLIEGMNTLVNAVRAKCLILRPAG